MVVAPGHMWAMFLRLGASSGRCRSQIGMAEGSSVTVPSSRPTAPTWYERSSEHEMLGLQEIDASNWLLLSEAGTGVAVIQ